MNTVIILTSAVLFFSAFFFFFCFIVDLPLTIICIIRGKQASNQQTVHITSYSYGFTTFSLYQHDMPRYEYNKPPILLFVYACTLCSPSFIQAATIVYRLSIFSSGAPIKVTIFIFAPTVLFRRGFIWQRSGRNFTIYSPPPFSLPFTHNKDEMSETEVFCHSSRPLLQQLVLLLVLRYDTKSLPIQDRWG